MSESIDSYIEEQRDKQLIVRTSRPRSGIKPRDLTDKEIEALHGDPVTVQCGKSIAERIKLARGTISQKDAAEKCDTSASMWCQWETGKTAPRKSSVKAIAKALEVREVWLLTGIGPMYDKEQVESTPVVTHSEQITYTAPGLKITMGGTYTGAVVSTLLSGLRADGKYKVQLIVEDLRDGE